MKPVYYLYATAFIVLTVAFTELAASPSCDHPNFYVQGCENSIGPQGPVGPQGPKGDTGATGLTGAQGDQGLPGLNGVAGLTGEAGLPGAVGATGLSGTNLFDDNRLTGGIASIAALSAIPDVTDSHTGIGIGFAGYRGAQGMAIGIVHKVEELTLKASIGTNSAYQDLVWSAGGTFGF